MTAIATQTITLDLRPHYNRQGSNIVYCSQYDNDLREVVANIMDAGTAVNVSTYTIYIEGTKPDKRGFSYELTSIGGTVSNNAVTFPLQLQMTAVAGITNAEIVFYSGDDRIGSSNFILAVEKAGLADDIDVSETDIPAYVDGAQQAAANAEADALVSEGYARGSQNGTDVSSGSTYYENNSKYYYTQAQTVAASIPADYTTLSNDVDDLKSAVNEVVCPNLMGNEAGKLYPCLAHAADYLTISTSDGSIFPTNSTLQIQLVGQNGTTQVDYFGLKNGASSRTVQVGAGKADSYYLRWNETPSVPLMVVYGRTVAEYVEYFEPIRKQIQDIRSDLNSNAEIIDVLEPLCEGTPNYSVGYKIKADGTLEADENCCVSERIYIKGGTAIRFYSGIVANTNLIMCEYAADDTIVTYWGNVGNEYRDIVTLNANTVYIRITFKRGYNGYVTGAYESKPNSFVYWDSEFVNSSLTAQPPSYYFEDQYLFNKASFINNLLKGCAANGDAFVFITDEHWGLNAHQSPKLIRYIMSRTMIDKIIDGGDRYEGYGNDCAKALLKASENEKYFPVVGNHEFLYRTPKSAVFASGFMHLNSNNIVWGKPGQFYYYQDNLSQKIRYIFLQSFDENLVDDNGATMIYDQDQLDWVGNVALNVETGWTIIIVTHSFLTGNYATKEVSVPTTGSYGALASIIENYSGNGTIACIIQGHFHWDYMLRMECGVPVVVTTCDKYSFKNEPALQEHVRTPGTINEQAFDVVVLDKTNRKLTFVRIGDKAVRYEDEEQQVEYREITY